ncbi:MAG: hypothetical protein ABI321_00930 [Polyangia bacterium]
MSDATNHDQGHEPLRQEDDKVQSGTIIAVGLIALTVFSVGILWAVQIQKETTAIIFAQPGKKNVGTVLSFTAEQVPVGRKDEMGMVYQSSFDSDFATRLKAAQTEHMESVGWVDEKAKRVHIPIERAMTDYLAEVEKDGSKL